MNVGLVVEGVTDGGAYRQLLQRIRNNIAVLQVRPCGGKSRLKSCFVGHLKEFQRNNAWQIDVAFVIRDSDCHPPQQIEQQLRDALDASRFAPDFRVELFATPCMLESWLISDIAAIRRVAASRRARPEASLEQLLIAPQHSANDDDSFDQVLIQLGLPATPAVYSEIATESNFSLVEQRCNYFREFRRRVGLQ
jgi:Domain of unknown function (DUF4276)